MLHLGTRILARHTHLALVLALSTPATSMAIAFFDGPYVNQNTLRGFAGFEDAVGYIYTKNPSTTGGGGCSGTAISLRVVLTAAHCFDFDNDGRANNSRTEFTAWHSGPSPWSESHWGTAILEPGYRASPTGGFSATNDIAAVVLDTPLDSSTPLLAVYNGPLDQRALNQMRGGPLLREIGFGRHYEEGVLVGESSKSIRLEGLNFIDAYHDERGGTLSATLRDGFAITAQGDSGGPLVMLVEDFGDLPVVIGVTSYGRDNNRNGSYADLGDQAFWTYVGNFDREFLLPLGEQLNEPINWFQFMYNKFANCPKGVICKGEPEHFEPADVQPMPDGVEFLPPEILATVPEPSTLVLFLAAMSLLSLVRRRSGSAKNSNAATESRAAWVRSKEPLTNNLDFYVVLGVMT